MHILILNQTFYPDTAATAQHMWDLAQFLEQRGHKVSAVASRGAYGTDRKHEKAFERIGKIEIHRLQGTALGRRSTLARMMDFGSYYLAAGWHLQHCPCPDIILALTSPPMVSTLAMFARQFRQTTAGRPVRFVYYVMDLYPDAAVAGRVIRGGSIIERAIGRLTTRTVDVADAIIALGRDMKMRILREYGRYSPAAKIHVVPPWADGKTLWPTERRQNVLARELGLGETFNVVYSGNLGEAHDLETMTGAIEMTRNDVGLRWVFIGGGLRFDQLKKHAEEKRWPNVTMMPFRSREGLNESLNLADVHLVSQLPEFTGVVLPSKLFGILAVGRPSIMIGPADAECSRIIREHNVGMVVPNGDAKGLVDRVRELRSDETMRKEMGNRARAVFEKEFDKDVACGRIEEILKGVVGS